jgi:hypothetical protein
MVQLVQNGHPRPLTVPPANGTGEIRPPIGIMPGAATPIILICVQ